MKLNLKMNVMDLKSNPNERKTKNTITVNERNVGEESLKRYLSKR